MMRNLKSKLRSTKGQIGQILVVIVLIILAIMGVVQYIMPMFDKSKGMANAGNDQIEGLTEDAMRARYGNIGDKIAGQTVINSFNKFCKDPDVTVGWNNDGTATHTYKQTGNATSGKTYRDYLAADATITTTLQVNEMGTYEVIEITQHDNGKLKTITYKLVK